MTQGIIPEWEDPIYRFLKGRGELLANSKSGPAFTLWEALVNFSEEQYPLKVTNQKFYKEDLLFQACDILDSDEKYAKSLLAGFDGWEKIKSMCDQRKKVVLAKKNEK
ncbi:MAG: hypothetical protein M1556_01405 [Candidatus Thermoplasmatota archaeon]|jgi:hypothetical protein|nr:hypothetical protein [Candidatus Thermoplasmatota archaeon]MCL6002292.1 hypothetical protein [Candidatus Thermoplasmatota archaeon]